MLVLTRKHHQSVIVGGPDGTGVVIKVTVIEIRGDRVTLGFEADPEVAIHRSEVWERIFSAGWPDRPDRIDPAPMA